MGFNMNTKNIGKLQSGGLITNYYCSAKCAHCQYASSPSWTKDFLTAATAEKIAATLRIKGLRSIHIGGGEPLLNFDGMVKVLEVLNKNKISVEYIETNSSWHKDHDSSVKKLKQLQKLGIDCLMLSISPYHNEYIPLSKVKGLINACNDAGTAIFPWMETFWSEVNSFDENTSHSLHEYAELFGDDYLKNLHNRYYLNLKGRALYSFKHYYDFNPLSVILKDKTSCTNLLNTGHFHVDLYGNYLPSSCMGISIDMDDLSSALSIEKYPVINGLIDNGISSLYDFALTMSFKPDDEYYNKCHLCFDIRRYLVNVDGFYSRELEPMEFYDRI